MNDLERVLDRVGNRHRLFVLGDRNGWVRDSLRVGINGGFGVPGENDIGSRVIDFCTERGFFVCNSYFEHKLSHKYTWVARGQDGVEVKSMIDLLLAKKAMLRYVKAVRGMGGSLRSSCIM